MSRTYAVLAVAVALTTGGYLASAALGEQKPKAKQKAPRVASVHVIMEGIVQPNCKALAQGLKKGDASAAGELAEHAALLNEAGFLLMQNKRCPDRTWAQAARILRQCSAVVYQKLEAKDLEGAQAAFKAMTQACATCHKAHRKKD